MKLQDLQLVHPNRAQTKAFCPLCHGSRTRHKNEHELSVNTQTGVFFCHHCDASGILEGFIGSHMAQNGFAVQDEKKYIKPNALELKNKSEEYDEKFLEYFQNRGISRPTLETFGISYGPSFYRRGTDGRFEKVDGVPVVDKGIRFPYYENGELVNVKHLLPKEWAHDGERQFKAFTEGKPVPFGMSHVYEDGVIVEGEIDALSVYEAGINYVMSVPSGSKHLGWLEFPSVVELLKSLNKIYIAVDKDEDGKKLETELIRRLRELVGVEKLFVVAWPDECKDANDTLVKFGAGAILRAIQEDAKTVPIDGISEAHEFRDEFLDFYYNGLPHGISTGIKTLDPLYRVMPGMMTVVTGVPSHGKSEFMDEIVRRMAEDAGWKFAFYTPENHPTPLHMIKLAEKHIGKPFDITRTGSMDAQEVEQAMNWINENVFYINPRGKVYSVDEIIERARVLIYRKNINGLVIDPWNYVRKDFGSLREDQFINEELQKIGSFAKESNTHVWLIVHPRTLRRDKEGKIQVPTIHDLSGGSKFGDNTDFMFAVSRDPVMQKMTGKNEVMIHVQKARYRYAGEQGNVTVLWNKFNGRFDGLYEAVRGEMPEPEGEITVEEQDF